MKNGLQNLFYFSSSFIDKFLFLFSSFLLFSGEKIGLQEHTLQLFVKYKSNNVSTNANNALKIVGIKLTVILRFKMNSQQLTWVSAMLADKYILIVQFSNHMQSGPNE